MRGMEGMGGVHFNDFSFQHAEDIFNNFFGGRDPFASFFDDEDDFMMPGFGGRAPVGAGRGQGSNN